MTEALEAQVKSKVTIKVSIFILVFFLFQVFFLFHYILPLLSELEACIIAFFLFF